MEIFRKKIRQLSCVLAAALLLLLFSGGAQGNTRLNIIHVNDTHSHIEPDSDGNYGYARMKTVVDSIRNIPNTYSLFIHCGDMFPGTLYYNVYHGRSDIRAFNYMGLDIYILGNHEFDGGVDSLAAVLPLSRAEITVANIKSLPDNLNDYVKPYIIKQFGKAKVGIIGLLTKRTVEISSPGKIEFLDYIPVIKDKIEKLKAAGCEYILLATHLGVSECFNIIRNVSGIDLVLDGHTHTLLDTTILDRYSKPVRYRQVRHHGMYLGVVTIDFDDNGRLIAGSPQYSIIKLDSSINEAPEFNEFLERWSAPLEEFGGEVAGYINDDLPLEYPACRESEFALGNLIADAFLWYGLRYGAQIAAVNGGGIREDMTAPEVTFKEIYSVLPFDNTLDILTLTGEELLRMMNIGVSRVGLSGSGRFPHVSGIRYGYDYNMRRIKWLKIWDGERFNDLDLDAVYNTAVNSYMASGGDGYDVLRAVEASRRLPGLATQQQVIIDYLQGYSSEEKPFDSSKLVDGRIVVIK